MKKLLVIVGSIYLLVGCQTSSMKKKDVEAADAVALKDSLATASAQKGEDFSGCYQLIIAQDTADMNLQESNDLITGTLKYNRFEKDDNDGTVALRWKSPYLIGWYTFQSEGKLSVREIKLLVNGTTLSEAYGDVASFVDTFKYKYPDNLNYETNHPFQKIACVQ
ncbi:MAG: hypothetical protein ABIP68_00875 [Ferruginibacter sp.]